MTAAVVLLAASPVETGWHDGCTHHGGWIAQGIGVAYAVADGPADGSLTFTDAQTLMGCF